MKRGVALHSTLVAIPPFFYISHIPKVQGGYYASLNASRLLLSAWQTSHSFNKNQATISIFDRAQSRENSIVESSPINRVSFEGDHDEIIPSMEDGGGKRTRCIIPFRVLGCSKGSNTREKEVDYARSSGRLSDKGCFI